MRFSTQGGNRRRRLVAATLACCGCVGASADDRYLRGAVGVDQASEAVFVDRDCASASPAALYGCGRGGDGAGTRSVGDFGASPAVELAFGAAVRSNVRLEAVAEYRPRLEFDGRANFLAPERRQSVVADASSMSIWLAANVDVRTLTMPGIGETTPFIGLGIGAARNRIGETRMSFPRTTTLVPGGRRTNATWMLTAGLSKSLSERTALELAWRYADLGDMHTGRGNGQVVWRDGSREPLPLDLAPTEARLRSHGLRLAVRHTF